MHAVPRFQATGFKRDLAEFRVNPDQFGYPVVFPAILIAQLLGFNMGLLCFYFFVGFARSFLWFSCLFFCSSLCSPTAESFGVSAKLGPGALWGNHPARFREVPRFQVRVPSKGSGRFQGSK